MIYYMRVILFFSLSLYQSIDLSEQVTQSPIQRQLHRVLEECGESCSKLKVGLGDNQSFLMVSEPVGRSK